MPPVDPRLIFRIGTHAEKEYIEKTASFFDGFIIGGNLVEATPGASASLILKLGGKKKKRSYYIDPMTYAFGHYTDPATGKLVDDMDWIKSEQKRDKKIVLDFIRSYRNLSTQLGEPFSGAIRLNKALTPPDFSDSTVARNACRSVIEYQMNRIAMEFISDPDYSSFADAVPKPTAVFAPYFYIEPARANEWLDLTIQLAKVAVKLAPGIPVHAVICADQTILEDETLLRQIEQGILASGVNGVWLWFSKLYEEKASVEQLRSLRSLVEVLSTKIEVNNLHGNYFSLALCKYGMNGISHGVGYGEQKDVVPVRGQATPTVRYYLPALRRRLSIPDIERCFTALEILTPEDFHNKVCSCAVCKAVIGDNLSNFASFGELHKSSPESKRLAQTPAAAKRCRFHFLLNRIKERDYLRDTELPTVLELLEHESTEWAMQPTMKDHHRHIPRWIEVLQE